MEKDKYYLEFTEKEIEDIRNALCLISLIISSGNVPYTLIKLFNFFDRTQKKIKKD